MKNSPENRPPRERHDADTLRVSVSRALALHVSGVMKRRDRQYRIASCNILEELESWYDMMEGCAPRVSYLYTGVNGAHLRGPIQD